MTIVTREMIGAAHDVILAKGDFVLSANLLERIYLAMDQAAPADAVAKDAGWQPIETAPNDGTYLCLGHGGTPFICLARNGEWFRQSAAKRVVGLTHYMPIPAAPKEGVV